MLRSREKKIREILWVATEFCSPSIIVESYRQVTHTIYAPESTQTVEVYTYVQWKMDQTFLLYLQILYSVHMYKHKSEKTQGWNYLVSHLNPKLITYVTHV